MRMSAWFADFGRDRRGASAVEFALLVPFLLTLLLLVVEGGRAYMQTVALEKNLRAGAVLAARSPLPISAATRTVVANLVRTGDPTGASPPLTEGWSHGATVDLDDTSTFEVDGTPVPVIRLTAQLPYVPLLPLSVFPSMMISATHEQLYIGD